MRIRKTTPRTHSPVPQHRGDVLDRRDNRQPLDQPLLPSLAVHVAIAEHLLEHPTDLLDVGVGVDAFGLPVIEHTLVGAGVNGFLADEAEHLLAQPGILDQREGLVDQVDEPPLDLGKQQVQHIAGVRDQWLVGHPVRGQCGPVERDVSWLEHKVLRVQRPGVLLRPWPTMRDLPSGLSGAIE
jgi:hypothetical protein